MTRATPNLRTWAEAHDTRVAITGATGWIGLALSHLCLDLGLSQSSGRLRLYGSQARTFDSAGKALHIESLDDAAPLGEGRWLIFHFAFLGKERTEDLAPSEFERINDAVLARTTSLVESAAAARLVFASSGAVYQPDRQLVGAGGNPYGYMKVRHEEKIRQWAEKRKIPLVTARIFNIGGPHINKQSRYALSDFIAQARQGGVITIGATKPVFRSFVHVDELCQVLFERVLDDGLGYQCFDTCGREIVEIGDLAHSVGRVLGLPGLMVKRPPLTASAVPDWYVGDGRIYQATLAASGLEAVGLDDIIRQTADFMVAA